MKEKRQDNVESPAPEENKKGRNPRVEYHEECTCCPVHYTWRDKPIPKREVTIEMIAELNRLYSSLHAEFHNYLQGQYGDRYYEPKEVV